MDEEERKQKMIIAKNKLSKFRKKRKDEAEPIESLVKPVSPLKDSPTKVSQAHIEPQIQFHKDVLSIKKPSSPTNAKIDLPAVTTIPKPLPVAVAIPLTTTYTPNTTTSPISTTQSTAAQEEPIKDEYFTLYQNLLQKEKLKEKEYNRRMLDLENREYEYSKKTSHEKESEIHSRELELEEREFQIQEREQALQSREYDVSQREILLNAAPISNDLQSNDIQKREYELQQREYDAQQKEYALDRREYELELLMNDLHLKNHSPNLEKFDQNREYDLQQREIELENKINDFNDHQLQLSAYDKDLQQREYDLSLRIENLEENDKGVIKDRDQFSHFEQINYGLQQKEHELSLKFQDLEQREYDLQNMENSLNQREQIIANLNSNQKEPQNFMLNPENQNSDHQREYDLRRLEEEVNQKWDQLHQKEIEFNEFENRRAQEYREKDEKLTIKLNELKKLIAQKDLAANEKTSINNEEREIEFNMKKSTLEQREKDLELNLIAFERKEKEFQQYVLQTQGFSQELIKKEYVIEEKEFEIKQRLDEIDSRELEFNKKIEKREIELENEFERRERDLKDKERHFSHVDQKLAEIERREYELKQLTDQREFEFNEQLKEIEATRNDREFEFQAKEQNFNEWEFKLQEFEYKLKNDQEKINQLQANYNDNNAPAEGQTNYKNHDSNLSKVNNNYEGHDAILVGNYNAQENDHYKEHAQVNGQYQAHPNYNYQYENMNYDFKNPQDATNKYLSQLSKAPITETRLNEVIREFKKLNPQFDSNKDGANDETTKDLIKIVKELTSANTYLLACLNERGSSAFSGPGRLIGNGTHALRKRSIGNGRSILIEEIQERVQNRTFDHKNAHTIMEKNYNVNHHAFMEKLQKSPIKTNKLLNERIHENLHGNTTISGKKSFGSSRRQSIAQGEIVVPVGKDAIRELVRNRITSRNSNHQ